MKFNPKAVYFWGALFCAAGCYALSLTKGVYAFLALAGLVFLLA